MFDLIDLNLLWFILVGVLLTGYAVLDGFDLGTGTVYLLIRGDKERRLMLNAIGPVWDGNEVWLITGGGALFAAFPPVYATVFSGFYLAFMLLLLALIMRAVSIEFRSKQNMEWWRAMWDTAFSLSSILIPLLIGVALANVLKGVPLDAEGNFTGSFLSLLNPYALLLGVMTVFLFAMHGCLFLILKTEGPLQESIRRICRTVTVIFILLLIAHVFVTLRGIPHASSRLEAYPWLYVLPGLLALSIAGIVYCSRLRKDLASFLSSCTAIICLMGLFGLAMFPDMVRSFPRPEHSLNVMNSSASRQSLAIMSVIAVIGLPLVLSYTVVVYRIFRGKVRLNESSY